MSKRVEIPPVPGTRDAQRQQNKAQQREQQMKQYISQLEREKAQLLNTQTQANTGYTPNPYNVQQGNVQQRSLTKRLFMRFNPISTITHRIFCLYSKRALRTAEGYYVQAGSPYAVTCKHERTMVYSYHPFLKYQCWRNLSIWRNPIQFFANKPV